MRWATYEHEGRLRYGAVVDGGIVDASRLVATPPPTLRHALEAGALPRPTGPLPGPELSLDEVRLAPPLPNPHKIICVGMNYHEHREEMGSREVGHPTLFPRWADTQVGSGAPVPIPTETAQLDYEGELALVIGRPLYRATEEEVPDAIAAYGCYNDFSVRDWQFHTSQWLPGKNFPGTGAFGPWLLTVDECPEVEKLHLVTTVNGEERQSAPVSDLIFSIPEIVSYVSSFTHLSPGDVIVTGTPAGVGMRRTPPEFLAEGDVVTVEIEPLGRLVNTVVGWREPVTP